jgi:hypothetical protein
VQPVSAQTDGAQMFLERQAIEKVLYFSNLGFELSDPDMFANAFAEDAVYILDSQWPIFGFEKLRYTGRDDIRTIITRRLSEKPNPDTQSFNPATLRRFSRNSNQYIEIIDATHARHYCNWMAVMRTNVDIHTSAIGRYEDELEKRNGQWYIVKRVRRE